MSEQLNDDFKVDTLEQAQWAMRKYRSLAQRVAANEALADAEHDRITTWKDAANAGLLSRMEWYEEHLKAYALSLRAQGQKSVSLPDGEIKTRASAPTFDVDRARFVEWAQEQKREDVLRVAVSPDLSAIKTAFVADGATAVDPTTGEVVPGLIPVPESVTVSLAPDLTASGIDEEDDDE